MMRSCLYECSVMHQRLRPFRYGFKHHIFTFCLDLDEIPELSRSLKFFKYNRAGVFSFYDSDHLGFQAENLRGRIEAYTRAHGVETSGCRIKLVTHLRVFGYVFNPVSFYFCTDLSNRPVCAVAEVGNTFGEMKPYFLGPETLQDGVFCLKTTKYFYVSPFIQMDSEFEFHLRPPSDRIHLSVNGYTSGKPLLIANMTGYRRPLSDASLCWYALKFPLVTLKVIGLIHWHALRLYLKRLPFYRKNSHKELQRGLYGKESHQD